MKLTDLPGVGPVTEKKLKAAGIQDVVSITTFGIPELSEITGMDSVSTKSLMKRSIDLLREEGQLRPRFVSANEIKREDVERISTGCEALDHLFGGGIEVGATTEIYGEFGSGKTQLCHTMAVRTQLSKDLGGLDETAKILWIDTEDTFRPERIRDIAATLGLDAEKILGNIIHGDALNTAEQQIILEESLDMIQPKNIRLIICDSSTGLFRSEYIGRGNLSDRQGQLNRFVTLISRIATRYKCAVILTNQVMKDPGQMFGDPTKPIGGDIFAHSSTYRVYFRKSGKNRIAKMVDSPGHAETEVNFALNARGITDIEQRDEDLKVKKKK